MFANCRIRTFSNVEQLARKGENKAVLYVPDGGGTLIPVRICHSSVLHCGASSPVSFRKPEQRAPGHQRRCDAKSFDFCIAHKRDKGAKPVQLGNGLVPWYFGSNSS